MKKALQQFPGEGELRARYYSRSRGENARGKSLGTTSVGLIAAIDGSFF
jgi:hypothetical protein